MVSNGIEMSTMERVKMIQLLLTTRERILASLTKMILNLSKETFVVRTSKVDG